MNDDLKLTWRMVFDSNHGPWRHFDFAVKHAYDAGYPYVCWNGSIYTTLGEDTGLTVEDVK